MAKFEVKNTEILLKYLNCLERVFFIDNKWMPEYENIEKNLKKDYEGVPKFLDILLDYFDKNGLVIFRQSLPKKDDLITNSDPLRFVVLDSVSSSLFISEEETKNYTVIVCPDIERVFHFKTDILSEKDFLKRGIIENFDFHASLPRIKIYSKDIQITEEKSKLEELKCMYTLPEDASLLINSLKIYNHKILWGELVADPSYGVQVGNLGLYYISPIKIREIKTNPEELHQVILIVEDWNSNKFEFSVTSEIYRRIFNEFPKPGSLESDTFLRVLTFQGYGENFRHILSGESIDETKFIKDSTISFLRFRKVVDKDTLGELNVEEIKEVQEHNGKIYYLPEGFGPKIFDSQEQFKTKDWADCLVNLKKYHEFESLCRFHSDWMDIYHSKIKVLDEYNSLKLVNPPTCGVHRNLLKNLLYKWTFYTRNKEVSIFCTYCNSYLENRKVKDIPERCPICNSIVLIALNDLEDAKLFDETSPSNNKLIEKYYKLSGLFAKFHKYLYYTLNFTGYSINCCVEILNELTNIIGDEQKFFDKLFKLKESYDRRLGVHDVLYRLEKNEEQKF